MCRRSWASRATRASPSAVRILAALLVLGIPALCGAREYPPIASSVTPIKVTERVYYVQGQPGVASAANEGFNSNAGFVVTGEGVVVIDALGTPALGAALRRAICSVTNEPIRRVILTHYHADHFYGLAPLKDAGADICAQQAARGYFER